MLSSPRWTTVDMYLLIALCIFALRVTADEPAQAGHAPSVPQTESAVHAGLLEPPLPTASQIRRSSLDHVYLAVRCLGLAEMQRENACSSSDTNACRQARANVRIVEGVLWPKGRAGQFAVAYRGKSDDYARAYRAAANRALGATISSSELILTRDSAMCRQSKAYYEARLHEHEQRQPG